MKKQSTSKKAVPVVRLNHAAKTIEWFLHGQKYRTFGSEQYRV
jgi:hypothetical protein